MAMLSDMAGAEGKFLTKMVSFTTIDPKREPDNGYAVYRVKGKSTEIFVKYWLNGKNIVSNLDNEDFHSWLCVNGKEEMTKSKVRNAVYSLKHLAKYLGTELPERDLYNRVGYEELSDKSEKLYLCLHNRESEVVEVDSNGWRVIPEMTADVLFENPGMMKPLFRPERGGSISELREFVNVSKEHFMLVVGWLLVALNVKGTMDCPILWINAPKGTGKTTATKYLKRLIDPDTGGTIAPVAKIRDFAASVSSRFVVAVDNLSKISLKMSDTYCRAVTGDTISRRKLFTDNTVNNVNLHARLIMNGMNYAPARSDLQDRCFQIKLQRLSQMTRKTNEELEQMFEERGPHILGALLDALSAGLRNREYEPELGVNMRMRDACCFIMRVANTGVLPFSEGEFRNVLRQQKEYAESADKEPLHSNTILSLICDMANEKCEMNEDVEEVEVWNDSTGKLLEELSKRASKLERAGEKGLLKDIPKSPQKLGAELSKGKSALEENSIYVERGNSPQSKRKSSRRMTRIVYRPIEDYEDSDCEKMESETLSLASGFVDEAVNVKDAEKKTEMK